MELKLSNEKFITQLDLKRFKEKEIDLFFSLLQKTVDNGTPVVDLTFKELRNTINQPKTLRLIKDLEVLYQKLITMIFREETEKSILGYTIFNQYLINKEAQIISIQMNGNFKKHLIDYTKGYTLFDVRDLIKLNSSYSKKLYILLKKWDSVRNYTFTIEEFREKLGIPNSYKMGNIDQQVLNPCLDELQIFFPNLTLEKIKPSKALTGIKFSWSKPSVTSETLEITISDKLSNTIDKARQNRFIQPFLTDKGISTLTGLYTEEELIKGLNHAYKNIKIEIQNIRYLIKTIDSALEEVQTVITIEKSKESSEKGSQSGALQEINNTTTLDQEKQHLESLKIDITQEEYNIIEKKALEDIKESYRQSVVRMQLRAKYNIIDKKEK